jgi:hypothetical protein
MSKILTVREVIEILSKIEDKEVVMMVDCPHCGRGNQLAGVAECVLLRGEESEI